MGARDAGRSGRAAVPLPANGRLMWIRILLGWIVAAALGIWIGTIVDEWRRAPAQAAACDASGRGARAAMDCDA
jgi:hypothetical protein